MEVQSTSLDVFREMYAGHAHASDQVRLMRAAVDKKRIIRSLQGAFPTEHVKTNLNLQYLNSCAGTLSATSIRSDDSAGGFATGSTSSGGPLASTLARALTMGVTGQCCACIYLTLETILSLLLKIW